MTPSKLRTDEVSFEEPESIEVSVESSLSTEVSFGPPVPMKRLFDAPPSLEPPHADKNTEIESTLAEKNCTGHISLSIIKSIDLFSRIGLFMSIFNHLLVYHAAFQSIPPR